MISKNWPARKEQHATNELTESLKISSTEIQGSNFADRFLHYIKNFKITHFMILCQRQARPIVSLKSPSLLKNNRFKRESFLVSSLSICDYKLSSINFRNYPDLLVTAVWQSQVLSGKLKSPIRIRGNTTGEKTKLKKRLGSPGGQKVENEWTVYLWSNNHILDHLHRNAATKSSHVITPFYSSDLYGKQYPSHWVLCKQSSMKSALEEKKRQKMDLFYSSKNAVDIKYQVTEVWRSIVINTLE